MTYHARTLATGDHALLDRPIWNALTTCLEPFTLTVGAARALPADISPLAATASSGKSDIVDLRRTSAQRGSAVVTLERDGLWQTAGMQPDSICGGVQMVAQTTARPKGLHPVENLGHADAQAMFDLAHRTKPGPFKQRTHILGDFIGIKRDGALVAMAGQRLRLPGFVEISAVCVAPEYRGLGMAAELMRHMCTRIFDQGETPFLHAYQSNITAIQLYGHLGFELRAKMQVAVWQGDMAGTETVRNQT